jgi:polyferredoxin
MIKRIIILVVVFIIGLVVSLFTEPYLREWIQYLFKISTNNAIQFTGKNFHLFASSFYYASFGFMMVLFWVVIMDKRCKPRSVFGLLSIIVFALSLTFCCYVNSNLKIAQCTACNDGVRRIHYNEISYEGLIITSLIISILPIGVRLIRKPAHNIAQADN